MSFTGDGSGLTGVGGATKFYTNLPYMGDDGAQVLLDDDFAIGSDDFYLEIRFLLGSVNGEGKIFALGGTTDATGPNGAFYATKGSFGGVNVYASPTGTVANKFTTLGNAAESPGIYNSIILARSGTNVALYYNGVREYFGNPNEITTLTSGALSLWGLCDGTGGAAGAADGQTSGFLFNKGSSVIDITQTTTATTLGVASSQFSEVAYGSDITLQSALPYLAIGDATESALKFGTEQVGYTYSGSFALKGNPSASVSGEQLATRLYNYGSSINLVAPNDAYIGTRYGAISINYPKTRHDQSAGGSHEFRVNDVVRATINGTDATFVDTVNATAFVGDGSGLTNLPAGGASSLQAVTTVGSTTTDSISIGGLTINNQYIMPTANGATGYYLTSNSNGSVTWTAPPGSTTPNLQAVTTAGATTSSIITVAGLNSARSGAGTNAFSAGLNAGLTSQGNYTVAIGDAAGKTSQGQWAVAIGYRAGEGTQGMDGVGIGNNAGNTLQGNFAVAVGGASGSTNQGNSAVALGRRAGQTSQGANAIAIGDEAGKTNQAANSIVMNATSAAVENTTANTFVVKPVRDVAGTIPAGFKQVAYNPTTGEFISYG